MTLADIAIIIELIEDGAAAIKQIISEFKGQPATTPVSATHIEAIRAVTTSTNTAVTERLPEPSITPDFLAK